MVTLIFNISITWPHLSNMNFIFINLFPLSVKRINIIYLYLELYSWVVDSIPAVVDGIFLIKKITGTVEW